jgi:hypothetical protein
MKNKFEFGSRPLDEVDEYYLDVIEQAFQSLAREGLIVDSGRREWSELTGRYEIVWVKNLN